MKNNFFNIIFFIAALALYRLIPHPPNFTPILATAVMCPLLFKDRLYGIAIPVFAMFISDIIIGFHPYQFVIYATILSIGFFTPMKKNLLLIGTSACIASLWFFFTSNFAVWIIWDYYPKTFEGFINCYTLALPFFKNTIISTLFFSGTLFFLSNLLSKINKRINFLIFNK
tara:strand:- start:1273 stop:1785 length:513 start_codon:yes stop_codon:yes gene_type:complete